MKYSISYFYQIRFFKPNQVPVSTALWDPKWFHQKEGVYLDKNGVLNGLRMNSLNPTTSECACSCKWKGEKTCPFKEHYLEHLRSLDFKRQIGGITNYIRNNIHLPKEEELEIVFIVYETPDNPCSERSGLIQWFKENDIELKEWRKND